MTKVLDHVLRRDDENAACSTMTIEQAFYCVMDIQTLRFRQQAQSGGSGYFLGMNI
jgi:hypothetical protein